MVSLAKRKAQPDYVFAGELAIAFRNLDALQVMLAEKAADLIRGRPPFDPLDVPVHIAPDWEKHQR
jgi:choline dehydrogenase